MMLGFEPGIYWKAMWVVITPLAITFIVIMSAVSQGKVKYVNYEYPDWAQGVGWMMVAIPIALILGTAIVQVICHKSFRKAIQATSDWGPALPEDRVGLYASTATLSYGGEKNHAYAVDIPVSTKL